MDLPDDQVRFLLGIVISIPLSLILRYLSTYTQRKYFSLTLGVALQYYVYQSELWIPLLVHLIMYNIIKAAPRKNNGAFITILSIIVLSSYHIYRLIVSYGSWNLDVSTIMMMFVCRYSMFAYAYQDGGVSVEKLKYDSQKINRQENLPTFIDFFGYCSFLPTCIIVTAFQYRTYDQYLRQLNQFSKIPLKSSIIKGFYDLGIGLISVVFYAIGLIYFPISKMQTNQFPSSGILYISYYSFFSITLIRFKYYFGWKISQFPVHASGISYEPHPASKNQNQTVTKRSQLDDFDGIQAANPWEVESTLHLRIKIANWNMSVQEWLRKCVYERLPVSKSLGQLITFVVSAIWHGYYGGYYFSFFFWFLMVHLAGLAFKFSQQQNHPIIKVYKQSGLAGKALLWFAWNWVFTHNGLYFHVLSLTQGLKIMKATGFVVQIGLIIGIVIFTLAPGKSRPNKVKQAKEAVTKQN